MVAQLHDLGAAVSLAVIALFGVAAAGAAAADRVEPMASVLRGLRLGVAAVVGLEAAVGLVIFATGGRPAQELHLLYGLAVLIVVPFALTLTSEAPPRARAGVLAVAALVQLLLVWRLYLTG